MKSRYFVAIIFYLCTSSLASGVNHNALIISGYEAHVFLPNKPGIGSMTFNDLHYIRIYEA